MQTEGELKKLTVPQLKALCKDSKKISGYSKLNKDALVQKLLEIASTVTPAATGASTIAQTATPAPNNSAANQNPPSTSETTPLPLTAPSSDPPTPNPTLTDAATAPRTTDSEPAAKPRPKKRKNPPASQDSLQPASSSHIFKVPEVPQRPTPSTAVSSATSSTTTTTPASKKIKKVADKSIPSVSNAVPPDAALPPTAPKKKKKTVPAIPPAAAAAIIPAAADAVIHPLTIISAESAGNQVLTNSVPSPVTQSTPTIPTTNAGPSVLKRPSTALPPTNPPPAKKHKVASLPPISKPPVVFKTPLPKTVTSLAPSSVQPVVNLPLSNAKRFVPLVVKPKQPAVPIQSVARPVSTPIPILAAQILYHLDFPTSAPPPPMISITIPPPKAQRKRVLPRFCLLLSYVADEDLRNCVLVSRTFRYAVYLSATERLKRDFSGKRSEMVLAQYSPLITNMWPYLKQRTQELSTRKHQYNLSFLSRFLSVNGASNPISERLWTSPSNERQIVIALRFLLTRMFFQVSVGGGKEGKGWDEGQIVDAQELVKDEVWTITVRHSPTSTESFYVLEPTCEPLTAMPNSPSTGVPVRADWSTYILHRAMPPVQDTPPVPRLLDFLTWTNHEEYQLGISRLWLKRIEAEGATGRMKRVVAERYIFACVVANSLSGRYMSATEMAQDFAGLPDVVPARVKASPKVNLFLPAHHHVESVHFTTSGRALHNALAIVQTPGRIYYILRDNGMQVGCEEEGVAEVWMGIVGCDNSGVASRR